MGLKFTHTPKQLLQKSSLNQTYNGIEIEPCASEL